MATKKSQAAGLACKDYSGVSCNYVATEDDGNANWGTVVDHLMARLGQHMAQDHSMGLTADARAKIRKDAG